MYISQYIFQSVKQNYNKLLFEILTEKPISSFDDLTIKSIFKEVIENQNIILFNFLKEQFSFERIDSICDSFYLLNRCCKYGFFEFAKELTEFILSKNPSADFTSSFYLAICGKHPEIYKYFIDKDVKITIRQNDTKLYSITQLEKELCVKLLDKIDPVMKDDVLNEIFELSVKRGNRNLVELLIDKSRLNYLSLINGVKSRDLEIVNMILNIKNDPSFINTVIKEGTALNIAVRNNSIEIVKRLLSLPGINTVLYDNKDNTPLMTAISNFNIEMIDLFVEYYGDQIGSQIWQMNKSIQNILKLLSNDDEKLKQKVKKKPVDDEDEENEDVEDNIVKVNLIDTKSTFILNKEKMLKTMSKLSEFENVDFNCHFSSYTLLSYACEVNDLDLFNFLLKTNKVDINTYSPLTGNTPLIVSILNGNTQIAQNLIENNRTDINHRNYSDQTALTISASKENEFVLNSLIHNEKFDCELSATNKAYFKSSPRINKLLFKVKQFDINMNMKIKEYVSMFVDNNDENVDDYNNNFSVYLKIPFITPLIKAVFDLQEEIIDDLVSHPSFDKEKSRYIDAIFASIYMNDIDIFRKLISLFGNDVNLVGFEGKSLLWFSIFMRTTDITTEILNHNSFDSLKSNIVSAFLKAGCFKSNLFGTPRMGLFNNTNNAIGGRAGVLGAGGGFGAAGFGVGGGFVALVDRMEDLFDYDEQHNKLIKLNESFPSGKTYFTSIPSYIANANSIINFLIARGVNPNLPDANGLYPIEYAIQSNNNTFIQSMIHANNIDLSIKSKGNSFLASKGDTVLHMLMMSDLTNIVNEVLNMEDLDIINKENENGDTPLLTACKACRLNYIMILFSKNNLDYKHRNKEGHDALDCLKSVSNIYMKGQYQQVNRNYGWGGGFNNQNIYIEPEDIESEEKREYYKKILDFF